MQLPKLARHLSEEEFWWLFVPGRHMSLLTSRRADMILFRVRLVAALFSILTALWILLDIVLVPWPVWGELAIGRVLASGAFVYIALGFRKHHDMRTTYLALAGLYAIPTLFYAYSFWILQGVDIQGVGSMLSGIYAFLPFIMIAGLGMFPLTALESLIFALPVVLLEFVANALDLSMLNLSHLISAAWLSLMLAVVAMLSGMSQLGFMIALVRQAVRDPLTKCFSRLSGEELLEIQFIISTRSNAPLSVVFVDLDNFKSVNDNYGHDAGDKVLLAATEMIRSGLRTGDMLVRWGGEEFVLILPSTYCDEAVGVLQKLRSKGLGTRPDGSPITASIGVAERTLDSPDDWRKLVEAADQRMYTAKQSGKDRVVACSTN